jgi:hypothetical protein
VPLAAATLVGVIAFSLPMPTPNDPVRASVTTRDIKPPPDRTIAATVRLDPADAADDAEWLNMTAWQGGGSVIDRLRKVGPGTYVTTKGIPVHGNWKTTLRLQHNRAVLGLPVFLPRDTAIPVGETPATKHFERTFVQDKKNLQREQKKDVAGWLTAVAYLAVLAIYLGLLTFMTWGMRHLEDRLRPGDGREPPPAAATRVAPTPRPSTA